MASNKLSERLLISPLGTDEDEYPDEDETISKLQQLCHLVPRRYFVSCFLALGLFNVYAMRVNLSVAIEPMSCQFAWNSTTQGIVLAAFFAGYFFGNIPGGYLSERYGGKLVFGVGVLFTALLTALLPLCTSGSITNDQLHCYCKHAKNWCFYDGTYTNDPVKCNFIYNTSSSCHDDSNVVLLIILRFLMGLFESVTFPALYNIINNWSGKSERSRLVSIALSGMYIGNILGFPLSSSIIEAKSDLFGDFGGWKLVFYVFSVLGFIWCIFWQLLIYDSPVNDAFISRHEREFILSELPLSLVEKHVNKIQKQRMIEIYPPVPETVAQKVDFCEFLKEPSAWALYAAHFSYGWMFYTLLTELPTYLSDELNFDLSSAGFIAIVPYLSQFVLSIVGSFVVDQIVIKQWISTSRVRKIAQTLATIIPGILLVICGYVNNSTLIVILISVCAGFMGISSSGFSANYADISPTQSGILFGISNTIATIPGFVSPSLSGWILSADEDDQKQEWKVIFFIAFAVLCIGTTIYCKFGTAEPIPSLNDKEDDKDKIVN